MTILQKLIEIANKEYDGHFTLMKFTADWGCCFGTLDDTHVTSYKMSHGNTMSEAIRKCIANRTDSYHISDMENGKMILITDKYGNVSRLCPGDKIKVMCKNGKESIGKYLGECSKSYECGHFHFDGDVYNEDSYCNYYYPIGKKKYLTIYEYYAHKTTSIDETSIASIVVLKHKKVKDTGNV